MKFNHLGIVLFAALFVSTCENGPPIKKADNGFSDSKTDNIIKEQFVRANQQTTQKENDEMDYYTKTHKMPFKKTLSGIRYYVYKHSEAGDSIRKGSQVTMYFQIKLLNGTECYSSATEGPKTFLVGQEDLESGIHKGVQLLKRGDKAIFLIPSVLAHGLLGDSKKIPPQMPIVYDVEIK